MYHFSKEIRCPISVKIYATVSIQTPMHRGHREQVIVTLRRDADVSKLETMGMEISNRMGNLPIVCGTIDANAFKAISGWDGIERIEPDSEMRALD